MHLSGHGPGNHNTYASRPWQSKHIRIRALAIITHTHQGPATDRFQPSTDVSHTHQSAARASQAWSWRLELMHKYIHPDQQLACSLSRPPSSPCMLVHVGRSLSTAPGRPSSPPARASSQRPNPHPTRFSGMQHSAIWIYI